MPTGPQHLNINRLSIKENPSSPSPVQEIPIQNMFNFVMNYKKILFVYMEKYYTYENTRVFCVPWKAGGIS
jgi:hypothetical protein